MKDTLFGAQPFSSVELNRNLRRSILRGAPWIYRESLKSAPQGPRAHLAQLLDPRGEFLAWVLADPHSPLAARVLSLNKRFPDSKLLQDRVSTALSLRMPLLTEQTNALRWIHGEGDLLPGLIVDLYGSVAVVQTDGQGPDEFWNHPELYKTLSQNPLVHTVVYKPRRSKDLQIHFGTLTQGPVVPILENGAKFNVSLKEGQKTGFFLDQRDNRQYSSVFCKGKNVLNVFSYTGGFSVFAGLGKARAVASLDAAMGALNTAQDNWRLNKLPPEGHEIICADAFKFLAETRRSWDVIFVDPPSMTHSKSQKDLAVKKYVETFALALKRLVRQGDIFFSSCSSHISQSDFLDIIDEALSTARRYGHYLRISSQGADHPFPHAARELQYLKFAHIKLHD